MSPPAAVSPWIHEVNSPKSISVSSSHSLPLLLSPQRLTICPYLLRDQLGFGFLSIYTHTHKTLELTTHSKHALTGMHNKHTATHALIPKRLETSSA